MTLIDRYKYMRKTHIHNYMSNKKQQITQKDAQKALNSLRVSDKRYSQICWMEAVKDRIKRLREENRYTQTYLGELLGITYTAYYRYEKGESQLKLDQAKKLAKLYNVSINYIMDGDESDMPDAQEKPTGKTLNINIELDGTETKLNETIDLLTRLNSELGRKSDSKLSQNVTAERSKWPCHSKIILSQPRKSCISGT